MSEMNLIITTPNIQLSAGGVSRYLLDLGSQLARRKISFSFLCASHPEISFNKSTFLDQDSFNIYSADVGQKFSLDYFNKKSQYEKIITKLACKNLENIVIHDHGIWLLSNHFTASFARNYSLPLVITPHGMLEPWSLGHSRLKKKIAMMLYQNRDLKSSVALHVTSYEEYLNVRRLGFNQPIALIPNAVNFPNLANTHHSAKIGKTMLFLSRIHPKKGVQELIQAWARVRPPGWNLVIAGPDEGGHTNLIKKKIAQSGLESSVSVFGPAYGKEKELLFLSANIFILPTYSENFGLVIAEALSYGLPVITTKGTPWESLIRSKSGWWIDFGVDELAKTIEIATSLSNDELMRMGSCGAEMVRSNYNWDIVTQDLLNVYSWLLGHAAQPSCVIKD